MSTDNTMTIAQNTAAADPWADTASASSSGTAGKNGGAEANHASRIRSWLR